MTKKISKKTQQSSAKTYSQHPTGPKIHLKKKLFQGVCCKFSLRTNLCFHLSHHASTLDMTFRISGSNTWNWSCCEGWIPPPKKKEMVFDFSWTLNFFGGGGKMMWLLMTFIATFWRCFCLSVEIWR